MFLYSMNDEVVPFHLPSKSSVFLPLKFPVWYATHRFLFAVLDFLPSDLRLSFFLFSFFKFPV